MGKQQKINTIGDDIVKVEAINTFRMNYEDGIFFFDFGRWNNGENEEKQVQVVTKVSMPDQLIERFIVRLLTMVEKYQEEYGKKIIEMEVSREETELKKEDD
jgi:hypothetical protein